MTLTSLSLSLSAVDNTIQHSVNAECVQKPSQLTYSNSFWNNVTIMTLFLTLNLNAEKEFISVENSGPEHPDLHNVLELHNSRDNLSKPNYIIIISGGWWYIPDNP